MSHKLRNLIKPFTHTSNSVLRSSADSERKDRVSMGFLKSTVLLVRWMDTNRLELLNPDKLISKREGQLISKREGQVASGLLESKDEHQVNRSGRVSRKVEVWSTKGWTQLIRLTRRRLGPHETIYRLQSSRFIVHLTTGTQVLLAKPNNKTSATRNALIKHLATSLADLVLEYLGIRNPWSLPVEQVKSKHKIRHSTYNANSSTGYSTDYTAPTPSPGDDLDSPYHFNCRLMCNYC